MDVIQIESNFFLLRAKKNRIRTSMVQMNWEQSSKRFICKKATNNEDQDKRCKKKRTLNRKQNKMK